MSGQDAWAAYFFPPPDDQVMRNIPGIRNEGELREFEYSMTSARQRMLEENPSLVAHTFDAAHLKGIHKYLFQDVYDWAGEYRTVNMSKMYSVFADVNNKEVDRYLAEASQKVRSTDWEKLNRVEFVKAASEVFANLNQAHPFREGNGRTSKIFMEHVAALSNFELDYDCVSKEIWNQQSMFSGPDFGHFQVRPEEMYPVFNAIAVPRETSHETQLDAEDEKSRQIYQQIMNGFTGPTGANQQQTPQTPNRNINHGLNRESGYGLGD